MLDIYKTYYKLSDEPFRLTPDHRFSFFHRSYANAKAYLKYTLIQGEGFIAITGGAGTGKTTLISALQADLEKTRIHVATLTSMQLDPRNLLKRVVDSFGLQLDDKSKSNALLELEQYLKQQSQRGWRAVLIVDEAQGLSSTSLEELRLLSNLQHNNQLLLQVFLVGQEHLLELIRELGLEQLHQRLIATAILEPLDLDETVNYVEHRLCLVGWQGDPAISEDALRLIHKFSAGVPRRINLICHRLLLYGGLEQKHELLSKDARRVIEELHKEQLLPPGLSGEDWREGDSPGQAMDIDAPTHSLPRPESFVLAEKLSQHNSPRESVEPEAETTPVQPLSGFPGSKSEEGSEPSVPPMNECDLGVSAADRALDQSLQAKLIASESRPGNGRRWGWTTGFTILTGLLLAAAVQPDIRNLLTDFMLAVSSGTHSHTTTVAIAPEKRVKVLSDALVGSEASEPDRLLATGADKAGTIQRESAVATVKAGFDAPPLTEVEHKGIINIDTSIAEESHDNPVTQVSELNQPQVVSESAITNTVSAESQNQRNNRQDAVNSQAAIEAERMRLGKEAEQRLIEHLIRVR